MAQSFEPPDEVARQTISVDPIKVVAAKITVVALILLQTINDYQNAMGHGYDGSLFAAPDSQAAKLHR